ncbi:hypothetical protein MMC17_003051 [Xylographa soralifera]|nr:hypothetical protein [Xylographa soralifera]
MSTATIPQVCVLSCGDSPLSTTSNIVGILTFIYAILAGLYVNARWGARALRQSPQEFNDLVESLTASFEEYQIFAERLSKWREEDRVLANRAARIADACEAQLKDLRGLLEIESPERLYSNGRFWWWSAKFTLVQRKLKKNLEKKNELMEELRRLQQAFHIKSQETDLLRQRQLLLGISHRLDVVEQHQEVMARASGVPLEDVALPVSLYQSAEDILGHPTLGSSDDIMLELMRPRLPRTLNEDSLLSLARQMPLPEDTRSQSSVETWRMRPRSKQTQTGKTTSEVA